MGFVWCPRRSDLGQMCLGMRGQFRTAEAQGWWHCRKESARDVGGGKSVENHFVDELVLQGMQIQRKISPRGRATP